LTELLLNFGIYIIINTNFIGDSKVVNDKHRD